MKAAVTYEFDKPMVIEDVILDAPQKGEVKIRLAATAICHSDIHELRSEMGKEGLPYIGGHESAGYVEEVGEGVTSVKPGDTVVATVLNSCGECVACRKGLPHICQGKNPTDQVAECRPQHPAPHEDQRQCFLVLKHRDHPGHSCLESHGCQIRYSEEQYHWLEYDF